MKNDPPNKKLTYRRLCSKIHRLKDETPSIYRGVALLRRFRSQKKGEVALLRRANFEKKKGLPGRVDTSGTKTTIKTGNLWKCDLA